MDINACWQKTVETIYGKSISFGCLLKAAKFIDFVDGKVKLEVHYKFHKEKLEEDQKRRMLEETATNIIGQNVKFEYVLTEPPKNDNIANVANVTDATIEQMFS